MRSRKGYSLIEILITVVLLALIIVAIAPVFLKEVDKARGNALLAQARMVSIAAQTVVTEQLPFETSVEDLEEGLTGTVTNHSYPKQMEISKRINAMIYPEVVLSETLTNKTAKVAVKIVANKVVKTTFETILSRKHYTVIIENNVSTITHEKIVKKKK